MEFAVALFGALVNNALPKLLAAAKMNSKIEAGKFRESAMSIHRELGRIQAAIQTVNSFSTGCDSNPLQLVGFADLCCLAADIEDCIDSFHAGKMKPKQFYLKIEEFHNRSRSESESIQRWSKTVERLISRTALSPEERQQHHPVVAVPPQLQVFLGNNDASTLSSLNCLRYFCMFPCDHPVQRNPLIRRLIAEGLVVAEAEHRTLQEAAAQYLDNLITNKIVLPIEESNNGKVKRCKTPEDILGYISKDSVSKYFMRLCDDREQGLGSVRRLSVRPGSAASVTELNVPNDLCYVRTLAVFPAQDPVNYESVLDFPKYDVLRLLDLKECADVGEVHLKDICNLLMLKYLSLGDSILQVPKKVEKLKMLMTLDLGRTVEVTVFSEILELPNLKHLLGKLQLVTADIKFFRKSKLERFLSNGSRLETLSGFVTGKKQGFAMLLSHMKRLRKVKIWCNSPANQVNLGKLKEGIEVFIREGVDRSLCIDFLECYRELVESLEVRPAASTSRARPAAIGSISSLKLCGNLKKIPEFVRFITGIKEVCLTMTNLEGDAIISGLSTLSILEYLKIEDQSLGPLNIKRPHFPALKRLCLVGVERLVLTIEDGAMEKLVSLHLICKTLEALPGPDGSVKINDIEELKEIVLHPAISNTVRNEWERAATADGKTRVVSFVPSP